MLHPRFFNPIYLDEVYGRFADSLKTEARYFHRLEATEFIDYLVSTAEQRTSVLTVNDEFYRAQKGHAWDVVCDDQGMQISAAKIPYDPCRMKPKLSAAEEGRANPKGIPCLYCATKANVAISEVRPWIGTYVSLAKVIPTKELKVIDCTLDAERVAYEDQDLTGKRVWWRLNQAFSEPVESSDDVADYAPTQVLAEVFRERMKVDAIVYRSKLCSGEGKNIAIFNPDHANVLPATLHQVTDVLCPLVDVPYTQE